jgi:hypothetical protein
LTYEVRLKKMEGENSPLNIDLYYYTNTTISNKHRIVVMGEPMQIV